MDQFKFYAVTPQGAYSLPIPASATSFDDLYSDVALGVYSAFRTFEHHKFLRLDEHLARTERSMVLLGWEYRLDRVGLCRALHEVCRVCPFAQMRVRVDVLARPILVAGGESRVLIALMPFAGIPPEWYENGVAVELTNELERKRPLAKTADFAAQRHRFNNTHSAYEYLMVNDQGAILEGTGTNFYAVRDGVVYTAGEGVLEGITRQIILEVIQTLRIPLKLEAVTVAEISTLQEAAISGSSRALLPVVRIGEQVIGNGRPGPLSRRILTAYEQQVAREIKTAVGE